MDVKEKNKMKPTMKDFLDDLKLSRRTFMKASAAAGTAVATGAALKPTFRALAEAGTAPAGAQGEWKAATCQGCTSWCSKQVYVTDGRAVKVRGNPHSK